MSAETTLTILHDLEYINHAAEYLNATRYAGETLFGYVAAETPGVVYLVDEDEMLDLGRRLAAGERDAYSLWCAETSPESITAAELMSVCPEWRTDGSLDDLDGLRESAGAAGDYLTCAALDHLAADLRSLAQD